MMRKFRLFGVLLLVLALFPVRSYAVDFWPNGSYWNGITSPGHYAAFVRADDIYGAAAYGLNKDPVSLSSDVKLKLSDPNYGGKFYEYAQTFYNVEGWPNMPEWVPTYVLATSVGLGQSFERVYASEVTTTLRDEALRDFERVLAGEDLSEPDSSGGTNVSGGFPSSITLNTPVGVFVNSNNWSTNTTPVTGSQTINFSNPSSLGSYLSSIGCSYFYVMNTPVSYRYGGSNKSESPCVYFFASASPISFSFSNNSGSKPYLKISASSSSTIYVGYNYQVFGFSQLSSNMSGSGTFSGTSFSMSPNGTSYSVYPSRGQGYATCACWNGVSVPDPPAGVWPEPETPATPTAPEQPTPTAPTVEPDPTVTEPTPTWPEIPTPTAPTVVTVDTPEGLDYTQLLTLINDNLNDINSYTVAINSSLNSLRSDLVSGFDGVTQGLRNIYQYLQHLDDLLERHCKHIRDSIDENIYELELYLKDLFEWLPQQLDFDANFDYDDSGIKSYLQRILNKIPGGATGTPQTYMPNPQSDEPGFLDWLTDLWHRFLIDLVSVLPDELGGLVDAFSQLTHYFPFSIPWDLAALLALFEHEPVTPVFDVPWGFGGEEGQIEMVRVDLSAWDGVMEMVRPVFLVGFCWQLAMITKDLLANFDINKGGV